MFVRFMDTHTIDSWCVCEPFVSRYKNQEVHTKCLSLGALVRAASLARSRHAAHGAAVLALLVGGGVTNVVAHPLR